MVKEMQSVSSLPQLISYNTSHTNHPPPRAGFFIAAGTLSSCPLAMTLDTQMTLALLQELLMALGIEQLGRDVAGEVESHWMVPLFVEKERDRLMAVSFQSKQCEALKRLIVLLATLLIDSL